jgi:hypothetical protein
MADLVINIDMGEKCAECGKGGATNSGLCLSCVAKAMNFKKPMKTRRGQAMQAVLLATLGAKKTDTPSR